MFNERATNRCPEAVSQTTTINDLTSISSLHYNAMLLQDEFEPCPLQYTAKSFAEMIKGADMQDLA